MLCTRIARLALAGLAVAALTLPTRPALADTPAIDFTTPTVDFTNNTWSLGFKFTTNTNITVNSLGFYDDQKNGLSERHEVGIYDSLQNLLASTVVTTADPLDGFFRYASIVPLNLAAGQTYYVAGTTGGENYTWDPTGFTVDPAITFNSDKYVVSTVLAFPGDGPDNVHGYFGPNFKLDGSVAPQVPEPGSLALLVGVAVPGGLLALRRARRR